MSKFLQAKCRILVDEYGEVFDQLKTEVNSDVDKDTVNGDSAFEYAKKMIRKQGIQEGMNLLLSKMSKHANTK